MPTISKVSKQQRRDDWCSIFVDGEYAFSLPLGVVADETLHTGKELTQAELERLLEKSDFSKHYDGSLRKLLRRRHSEKEMRDYLRKRKAGPEDIDKVISKLRERGYIDDIAFAEWWVEERRTMKHRSSRQLRSELMKKGVEKSIIDRVLEGESDEADSGALKSMIIKKSRQSRYQDEEKLIKYLMRQGFNYGDIKTAITKMKEDRT